MTASRIGDALKQLPALKQVNDDPVANNGKPQAERKGTRRITLYNSLSEEWIKLPFAVMRECGPAAQTLGGLLKLTDKETFSSVKKIAETSRLPVKTCRNHLNTLHERKWIQNLKRQRTRTGRARRTCTIKLWRTDETSTDGYGVLPWWACCNPTKKRKLNWSERVVLSWVMYRLLSLKAVVEMDGDLCGDEAEFWEMVGGTIGDWDDRFQISLMHLNKLTGLDRKSITSAKMGLNQRGIIKWNEVRREDGGLDSDRILPRSEFAVKEKSAEPGRVFLTF